MALMTKASLVEEIEAITADRNRMFLALSDKANGVQPDGTASWLYGGQKWTADLFRAASPTGGYVVITFAACPKSVSLSVRSFDEWASAVRENGLGVGDIGPFQRALKALEAVRERVLAAAA